MGDFNMIKSGDEKIRGFEKSISGSEEFSQCCNNAYIENFRFVGQFLTWSNKRKCNDRIVCKLD